MATASTTAIPPAGDATSILINATSTNNSVRLSLSGGTPAEGASIAYYRIDFNDSGYKRVSNPVTFTDLSPNTTYYFYVDFVDNYGTTASGSKFGSIKTKNSPVGDASNISISVSSTSNSATIYLSGGTPAEGASIAYYRIAFGSGGFKRVSNPATFTGLSPNTTYRFSVDFVDNYGTIASRSTAGSVTTKTNSSPLPPTKGTVSVSNITYNGAKFTWSGFAIGQGATLDKYQYRFQDDQDWIDCGANRSITITDRRPNTSYTFYVRLVDNYGQASDAATVSFTTTGSSVSDASNINISVSSTSNSATIYLSGGTPAEGASIAYYRISFSGGGYYQVSNPVTFTDLSPGTTYYFNVDFIDSYGNIASRSTAGSVTTKTNSSPLPPTKGTVSVSNITYNGAKFTWSGFAIGQGATLDKYQYRFQDDQDWIDCGANRSITITDRRPNTSYTFYVRLVDNYGQASDSAIVSFTTAKPPAGNATGILINATSTSNSVTISLSGGTPGEGASIAYYRIDFNDSGYKRVSNPVTFTDLTPNTNYIFYVDFVDNYGTTASGSTFIVVTTKNLDIPSKGTVTVGNITESSAVFSWSGFEFANGATWGYYRYSLDGSNWTSCDTDVVAMLTGLSANTSYTFYVQLVDNYGQASDAAYVTFKTKAINAWKCGKYSAMYIKVSNT